MNYSTDSILNAAIAKAGIQQLNAIRYLFEPPSHQQFTFLNRLRKYKNFIDPTTYNALIHDL